MAKTESRSRTASASDAQRGLPRVPRSNSRLESRRADGANEIMAFTQSVELPARIARYASSKRSATYTVHVPEARSASTHGSRCAPAGHANANAHATATVGASKLARCHSRSGRQTDRARVGARWLLFSWAERVGQGKSHCSDCSGDGRRRDRIRQTTASYAERNTPRCKSFVHHVPQLLVHTITADKKRGVQAGQFELLFFLK